MSPSASSHSASSKATALERTLAMCTDGICGLAVAAILVVVLTQVAGRLLGSPFSWTEELTRACFIWMVFTGIAAGIRHADAARVTVLLQYFPGFVKHRAVLIYTTCCLTFFALTVWTGWYMVRQQVVMNEQIATLGWPSWVIGVVVPLSGLLCLAGLWQSLRTHRAVIAATEVNF